MVEGISHEVYYVFSQARLNLVWPELDRVLPLNVSRPIVKQIWESYDQIDREKQGAPSTYFLRESQRILNPLLNQKLGRPADHPTWNNLLAYALREHISKQMYLKRIDLTDQDKRFKTFFVE